MSGEELIMSDVRKCYFLDEALEEAVDEATVIKEAERCHCSGECTLESGCVLYKNLRDTSETKCAARLKAELMYHVLGE